MAGTVSHTQVSNLKRGMRNALAITTLALGIGASTAMFSFVHPMLLHPFLYPRADRLVVIEDRDSKGGRGSSWPEARDIAKAPAFSDVAAWEFGFFFLTGVDEPEQIAGSLVTPNLFRTLGVGPVLGRDFRAGDDGVVILSDACWKRRFGADPAILGRSIDLDLASTPQTERYTVIGVMPPDFWMYYSAFEVFVPLPRASMSEDRKARALAVFARLRDGVTLNQARSAVSAIPHDKDWTTSVNLWEKSQTQDIRPASWCWRAARQILLLIATANVAGLLLVRAQGRRREIAIRAALGATPWRVMRLLVAESLKLGVLAGAVGVVLAWWGLRIMVASLPKGGLFSFLPSLDRVVIDLRGAWLRDRSVAVRMPAGRNHTRAGHAPCRSGQRPEGPRRGRFVAGANHSGHRRDRALGHAAGRRRIADQDHAAHPRHRSRLSARSSADAERAGSAGYRSHSYGGLLPGTANPARGASRG